MTKSTGQPSVEIVHWIFSFVLLWPATFAHSPRPSPPRGLLLPACHPPTTKHPCMSTPQSTFCKFSGHPSLYYGPSRTSCFRLPRFLQGWEVPKPLLFPIRGANILILCKLVSENSMAPNHHGDLEGTKMGWGSVGLIFFEDSVIFLGHQCNRCCQERFCLGLCHWADVGSKLDRNFSAWILCWMTETPLNSNTIYPTSNNPKINPYPVSDLFQLAPLLPGHTSNPVGPRCRVNHCPPLPRVQ